MNTNYEIGEETVITIREDGHLVGVFDTNLKKRSQIYSVCKEGGSAEVKTLLDNLNSKD